MTDQTRTFTIVDSEGAPRLRNAFGERVYPAQMGSNENEPRRDEQGRWHDELSRNPSAHMSQMMG